MKAMVILIKCSKYKRCFGARTQLMEDGDWWRTWAFPIGEDTASKEGFDKENIKGNLYTTEEYPGCPYCGTNRFVQCNKCGKLTCWNGENSIICEWCGNTLDNIEIAQDKFDMFGGGDI